MGLRWYQTEAIESIYTAFNKAAPGAECNPIVALPTGTGKSRVISGFTRRALYEYPSTRLLKLTHVKELIEQNAAKMREDWPNAPLGIYSAGLKSRDMIQPIIFGGVQSVAKCDYLLRRWFDLVVIDECHLLSPKEGTTYLTVLAQLRAVNSKLRTIGLSATPYRLGQGMLTDEIEVSENKTFRLFTEVCYDMTDIDGWKRLIAEGYLCPPITPSRDPETGEALTQIMSDDAKIKTGANGDFNEKQLQAEVNTSEKNYNALRQVCKLGAQRWSWLMFASGIAHAEALNKMLNEVFNIPSVVIHSERTDNQNDEALDAWKNGRVRCAVNMGKLTTGVDHPPCDLIAVLRPTVSPVLWVQMLGRGTRPYDYRNPGEVNAWAFPFVKQNCLILDFARNTARLGPVNDPKIPKKKGKGNGLIPVKICPQCGTYCHAKSRFCENTGGCNYEFPVEVDIAQRPSTEEIFSTGVPITEYFDVITVIYNLHYPKQKQGKAPQPPVVRVDYNCGMQRFTEWLCFEHPGYPKHRAHEWWRQHHWTPPPATTAEALQQINQARQIRRIRVWVNKLEGPEIMSHEH